MRKINKSQRKRNADIAVKLNFAADLTKFQNQAGQLGLFKTMHKIHDAVREVGFEIEESIAP